ncbi:MAG: hypothetical protein BMS9Abin18_0687 [Zetaproteobacteria bacterium]|nr:MAG: hypothetical protein BMS9Abin18_0687 [Zetaproteobacteria bacterium]
MNGSPTNPSPALSDTLRHDDDLVAVVRGHLHVEMQVNRLIEGLLPYPEEIESRLGWPQRVELSLALGLRAQYGPPLKKLGSIRNRFAHRPDVTLEDKDVRELYQCLHKEDKDIVLESYKRTQNKVKDPLEFEFKKLDVKDQFTLLVVAIHAILQVAVSKVTGEPIAT